MICYQYITISLLQRSYLGRSGKTQICETNPTSSLFSVYLKTKWEKREAEFTHPSTTTAAVCKVLRRRGAIAVLNLRSCGSIALNAPRSNCVCGRIKNPGLKI